jgi:asparagine synthase (glutamine-hydrolysing)
VRPDLDAIANVLTLRYNPARAPPRRPLSAADFRPAKMDAAEAESKAAGIIEKDLSRMKFKDASVLLSGGVDSVLTLAMLRSFRPDAKLSCVSMGFGDDDDEISAAREIARAHDCDFYELVEDDVLADLPKLVGIAREPRWNLYQFHAIELARSKSRLVFSGDGGDELFGGYTFRYQKFLSLLPKKAGWKERAAFYLQCHERDWVPNQERLFGPRVKFSWARIHGLLRKSFDNRLEPLDQVFLADFNGKLLHDWMPANSAFEKFLDAKIASLFLSSDMVRFASHVPWRLKYCPDTATGKIPLRAILKRHNVQSEPVKKGFSVNTALLWQRRGKEIAGQYVNSDSEVVRAGVISREWIEGAQPKLASLDVRYINKMLGLLALEVWWRLYVSKTIKSTVRL